MKPIRILITGSRFLDEGGRALVRGTLSSLLDEIGNAFPAEPRPLPVTIVHGAAHGVDEAAAGWAFMVQVKAEAHPADWQADHKSAGPKRNARMVARGADICLAFTRRDSKGTWGCLRMAADLGIPVRIYPLPKMIGARS